MHMHVSPCLPNIPHCCAVSPCCLQPLVQVVEKANKKAKLADKELDLYHLQDSDPLPAPELTAAVDRLFNGAEGPKADEAVLTGLAGQVGAAVLAGLWGYWCVTSCQQGKHTCLRWLARWVGCVSAALWLYGCQQLLDIREESILHLCAAQAGPCCRGHLVFHRARPLHVIA